jgi:hypothetical protein
MNTITLVPARRQVTAALALLFWSVAAAAVATIAFVPLKVAAVLAAAFALSRSARMTYDVAFITGIAWLALAVIAQMMLGRNLLMSDVLLLTWVAAPLLFARSR